MRCFFVDSVDTMVRTPFGGLHTHAARNNRKKEKKRTTQLQNGLRRRIRNTEFHVCLRRVHNRTQTEGLEGLFVVNVTSSVVKADGAATMTKSAATGQEAGLRNVP